MDGTEVKEVKQWRFQKGNKAAVGARGNTREKSLRSLYVRNQTYEDIANVLDVHKARAMAGDVASDLEDLSAAGRLDEARPLVERLETMCMELMRLVPGLSIDELQRMAGRSESWHR